MLAILEPTIMFSTPTFCRRVEYRHGHVYTPLEIAISSGAVHCSPRFHAFLDIFNVLK